MIKSRGCIAALFLLPVVVHAQDEVATVRSSSTLQTQMEQLEEVAQRCNSASFIPGETITFDFCKGFKLGIALAEYRAGLVMVDGYGILSSHGNQGFLLGGSPPGFTGMEVPGGFSGMEAGIYGFNGTHFVPLDPSLFSSQIANEPGAE